MRGVARLALVWLAACLALTGFWPRAVHGHEHHHGGSSSEHAPEAAGPLSVAADLLRVTGDAGDGRCVLTGNDVTLAWAAYLNDTVTLAASTAKPCYALGIALGTGMVNSTAYVAWINEEDGAGYVVSYYMTAKRGDHVLPTGETLSNTAVHRLPAGGISFRLSRRVAGSHSSLSHPTSDDLELERQPFLWGCFPSWSVTGLFDHPLHDDMHTSFSRSPTVVNMRSGDVLSGGGHASMWGDTGAGPGSVIVAHAALMALAWGLFFPGAALVARHGRDPPGQWVAAIFPVGGSAWFKTHLALVTVALVCVVVAFGIIYAHIGSSGGEHFEGGHQKLGLATLILLFLQPLNGVLRPPKAKHGEANTGVRKAWEFGHKWLGRLLVTLACGIVVLTGFSEMGRDGASQAAVSAGQAVWLLWCAAGLGGITIALEMARKQKRSEARLSSAAAALGTGGANAL